MINFFKSKTTLIVASIFLVALFFRTTGINWDSGQHLHPDERFLTMVTSDIKLPSSLSEYFSLKSSPLNPYNYSQYQFFVYGTFPVFLTKALAVILKLDGYDHVYLLGRFLSALFDSTVVILLYLVSSRIFPSPRQRYLPSLFYALCLLPLQLSHFYAVDTFLSFFIFLTFTFLVLGNISGAAVAFGLALGCKISAIYFAPIIGLFILYRLYQTRNLSETLWDCWQLGAVTFVVFRVVQPYVFSGLLSPNPQFLQNIAELKRMSSPEGMFPPSVQWLSKTPLTHSLFNLIVFGLGLPTFVLFIYALLKNRLRRLPVMITLSLLWIVSIYFYQGSQFAHVQRYFIIIYPFIFLVVGYLSPLISSRLLKTVFIANLLICLAFVGLYLRPHSRVQASSWIYDHLPVGSTVTNEYWDDPLPLYLPGHDPYQYRGIMLPLYDPDSPEKWTKINQDLDQADYIILSSNRLWASIPLVPKLYPQASEYYRDLFAGNRGFTKLVEINSYPGYYLPWLKTCYYLGPTNFPGVKNSWFSSDSQCQYPGVYFRDDIAEESFTVYDHPKVLIFSRHNY